MQEYNHVHNNTHNGIEVTYKQSTFIIIDMNTNKKFKGNSDTLSTR